MQPIRYRGWPIALAGADRVLFHPAVLDLAELEQSHPLVRFACALPCRPPRSAPGSRRVPSNRRGRSASPSELLMPADGFLRVADQTDAELAELFAVPIEQVSARRARPRCALAVSALAVVVEQEIAKPAVPTQTPT